MCCRQASDTRWRRSASIGWWLRQDRGERGGRAGETTRCRGEFSREGRPGDGVLGRLVQLAPQFRPRPNVTSSPASVNGQAGITTLAFTITQPWQPCRCGRHIHPHAVAACDHHRAASAYQKGAHPWAGRGLQRSSGATRLVDKAVLLGRLPPLPVDVSLGFPGVSPAAIAVSPAASVDGAPALARRRRWGGCRASGRRRRRRGGRQPNPARRRRRQCGGRVAGGGAAASGGRGHGQRRSSTRQGAAS
jgi:hypothetical protein